jgi:membrane protein DedA with SNARE-associated domain
MAFPSVLISVLFGMVLGLRFRALILVPAMAVVMAFVVAVALARAQTTGIVVLTVAASLAGLQISYFAGAIVRHWLPSARATRMRATSLAAHGR